VFTLPLLEADSTCPRLHGPPSPIEPRNPVDQLARPRDPLAWRRPVDQTDPVTLGGVREYIARQLLVRLRRTTNWPTNCLFATGCARRPRDPGDVSLVFRWWIGPQERPPVRGPSHCRRSEVPFLERTTGFEPATPTLARWCSTAEPRPREASSLGAPDAGLQPLPTAFRWIRTQPPRGWTAAARRPRPAGARARPRSPAARSGPPERS
jgi:hypothetical protein